MEDEILQDSLILLVLQAIRSELENQIDLSHWDEVLSGKLDAITALLEN